MTKTLTCPYCWHSFRADQLNFRCSDSCKAADQVFFTARESVKGMCPHGQRPLPRRFCPREQCHRALLREYLDNEGHTVAVIGSADAGKTTYIGVLLHELRGRVAARFNGMALDLLGDESRRNYEERFARPLFGQGMAVKQTAKLIAGLNIEPLIFTLKIPTQGRFRSGMNSMLSVFYDASGENVMTAEGMDPLALYLETASGLLVLIDPMQMPRLRTRYGAQLPPRSQHIEVTNQEAVIQRLAELLRESAKGRGKLTVPLAVAVTKIDMLRDTFEPDSPLRRESNHAGYYDDNDGLDVHQELRGWLEQWFGASFDNTVAANFADYRYFGLTALGAIPRDDDHLAESGVHPYRVEDPMLWLLSRFGSIKTLKGKR